MSIDLILKPSCDGCGSTDELYGSTCKHLTLCVNCGKSMAQKRSKCYECGTLITRLIREYNVRASSSNDKNYFIARFKAGLPNLKKKNENKWSLQKEGLLGRQVTDTLRDKFKNKPWLLEDETGQFQYLGLLQETQATTYYLLMLQGREFVAIPAASWYNFNKVAQYKQLTLEEAEEKMENRKETVEGRQKWMMNTAHSGAETFGEDDRGGARGGGGGKGGKKATGDDDDEANVSDRGDEDEEEESARKNRLGLNKKSGDDDEKDPQGGDLDFDENDIEKGDDWEYEEIFTDDDAEIDGDDGEDLATDIHAPLEINQDDEDEDEADEEQGEGGMSKSGKELNKLLKRTKGLSDPDAEDDSDDDDDDGDGDDDDDDDDDDDMEDDISPVLPPKKEAPKEEPVDNNSPLKAKTSTTGRGTSFISKSAKGKRKSGGEESKTPDGAPLKKVKTKHGSKHVESAIPSKSIAPPTGATPSASSKSVPAPATGPVTEDEIRDVLQQKKPVTTQDLVAKFKSRLKSKEDKDGFTAIMRRISKIKKTDGASFLVLRER